MADFNAILNNQRNIGDSSFTRPERKFPRLSTKQASESGMMYRILPLGNRWFSTSYYQVFLEIPKTSGEGVIKLMLNFPDMSMFPVDGNPLPDIWGGASYNPREDVLLQMVRKIIKYNHDMMEDPTINSDVLRLSSSRYPSRLNIVHEVIAIAEKYNPTTRGLDYVGTNPIDSTKPPYVNIQLNYSSWNSLLNEVMLKQQFLDNNGQPFETPMSFVRPDYNMPVMFTKAGNTYTVNPQAQMMVAQGLPDDYLAVDEDGLLVNVDDPMRFNVPLEEGDFKNDVVIPFLQDLIAQIPEDGTSIATGGNSQRKRNWQQPFFNQQSSQQQAQQAQPQQPSAPFHAQPQPTNTTTSTTQAPVQPQSQPVQQSQPTYQPQQQSVNNNTMADPFPKKETPQAQPQAQPQAPQQNVQNNVQQPQPQAQPTAQAPQQEQPSSADIDSQVDNILSNIDKL